MLRNAKSFHNKYFSSSPPDDPTTTTTSMNSHLLVAWEAKKEVELLRETVESMFCDFGDTLQEVLKERQPSDDEMSEQTEENLGIQQILWNAKYSIKQPLNDKPAMRNKNLGGRHASGRKKRDAGGRREVGSKEVSTVHVIKL